jgi:hypothetical protein
MISLVGSGSGLLDEGRFGSQKTGSSWLVDSRCIGEGAMELGSLKESTARAMQPCRQQFGDGKLFVGWQYVR